MKDLVRVLVGLLAVSLLGACGGGQSAPAGDANAGGSQPAVVVASTWDNWNWDEGNWGE